MITIILPLQSINSTAQEQTIQPTLGVTKGDSITYQITDFFGFENNPIFRGKGDTTFYASLGDIFTITIGPTSLSPDNTIEVEIKSDRNTINYENQLDVLDLIVFTDWVFWTNFMRSNNITFFDDGDFFGFQVAFIDTGRVIYLEKTYNITDGALEYQYLYIAPEDDIQNPLGYYEITRGVILPVPDKTRIGISKTDMYTYELTNINGFSDRPIFSSRGGDLYSNQTTDQIDVLVRSTELSGRNEVLLTISTSNGTIPYLNRMDFLNPILDVAFFVFTDWDYIAEVIGQINSSLADFHTIQYVASSSEFQYSLNYIFSDGSSFNNTVVYDIDSGALISQKFAFDDKNSTEVLTYEINLIKFESIDTQNLGVTQHDIFSYIVTKYRATEITPLFTGEKRNMWLLEKDVFDLNIISQPDNNDLSVRLSSKNQDIQINIDLDSIGDFVIYNDWGFWSKYLDLLNRQSSDSTTTTYQDEGTEFKISIEIDEENLSYSYQVIYEKTTGVLLSLLIKYDLLDNEGNFQSYNLQIDRYVKPTTTPLPTVSSIITTPTDTSTNKDSLGPSTFSIGMFLILFTISLKRVKAKKFNK